MKRPRFTIAGWMGLTAFVALNAALARALVVDRKFFGGILRVAIDDASRVPMKAVICTAPLLLAAIAGGSLAAIATRPRQGR